MKHLLFLPLFLLSFLACEKNELTTLEDLRSEAAVWQLYAQVFSSAGPLETQAIDSERTLQFWEGKIYSNGSFCGLSGPAGATQEINYDPLNSQFTTEPCASNALSNSITFAYYIDLEAGSLTVSNSSCIEGCSLLYRRVE